MNFAAGGWSEIIFFARSPRGKATETQEQAPRKEPRALARIDLARRVTGGIHGARRSSFRSQCPLEWAAAFASLPSANVPRFQSGFAVARLQRQRRFRPNDAG